MIKRYIEQGNYGKVFPEIRPQFSKNTGREQLWRDDAILIERQVDYTEATVEISSPTTKVVGRHYDILIMDDVVTEKNVNTPDQMMAIREFHEYCEALLDPGAEEIMIGTRYDYGDEYGRILSNAEIRGEYDIMQYSCLKDPLVMAEMMANPQRWKPEHDKCLLYPLRFTLAPKDLIHPTDPTLNKKSLVATRKLIGSWLFSTQYMNEPVSPDSALFTPDVIDKMWVDKSPGVGHYWFQVLDVSTEAMTKTSFTSLITFAVNSQGEVIVTDIFWGNYRFGQIATEILFRQKNPDHSRRPRKVGMGRSIYEKAVKPWLDEAARRDGIFVPVFMISGEEGQIPKTKRIERGLQPWVENGKIYIWRECRNKHILVEEMLKFPRFPRMDCLDALAIAPFVLYSPEELSEPTPQKNKLDKFLERAIMGLDQQEFIGGDKVMDDMDCVIEMASAW